MTAGPQGPVEPPSPAGASGPPRATAGEGARYAIVVLTAMNLLNYADRYLPSAVKELFKRDLGLTDTQTALPLTAFVVVYMLASPVFGALADRWPRRYVIAGGVALWSLATGGAAFATGFWTFLLARALVGVGEAAYATLTPPLISDLFPPERRNRVLTLFFMAIPVGAALGFALGGALGQRFGWRAAFMVLGFPGVAAALLALRMREPPRGAFDAEPRTEPPAWPRALALLLRNRPYRLAVAGYTAVTFASGALADWFPAFLARHRGFDVEQAGLWVGASAVIGGLGGTLSGGLLADRLRRHTRQPYLALAGVSMLVATALVGAVLVVRERAALIALLIAAQVAFWFYNGPINAVIVNAVPGALRARAVALSILAIHLLGDAISPTLVGWLADLTGRLPLAVSLVPATLALGAAIWLYAWRRLPASQEGSGPAP